MTGFLDVSESMHLVARVADVDKARFIGYYQNVPAPDVPYPGTASTGSLCSLTRAPLLPTNTFLEPNRPLIGIDPGQANHVTAVLLDPTAAYTALIAGGEAPEAKAAFKSRKREVLGRHSKERTLQARSERLLQYRKDKDRAASAEGDSVYDHIDNLRLRKSMSAGRDITDARCKISIMIRRWREELMLNSCIGCRLSTIALCKLD